MPLKTVHGGEGVASATVFIFENGLLYFSEIETLCIVIVR